MDYYIQGDAARAKEIKAAFEEKGCTLYRLASNCDSEDLIYYSLNGIVRGIKKDNLYLFEAHPGYKELELPVGPKFKVGNWITDGYIHCKITEILDDRYIIESKYNRRSAIEDAKDGDVLAADECYVIFKEIDGLNIKCYCTYHYMGFNPSFHIGTLQNKTAFNPATAEQRDLLFTKMLEAGYEWDADKKELKKITVKPKFKVGDWLYHNKKGVYPILITGYDENLGYQTECLSTKTHLRQEFVEKEYHLWSIEDAKYGDVLVDTLSGTRALTILFRSINEDDSISAYCGWNGYTFRVTIDGLGYGTLSSTQYVPATAEQRGLLFQKMKEAGYQWDVEKKELKKIQTHYDISNFHAGMPVLVRDDDDEEWNYLFFSHYRKKSSDHFFAGGSPWFQCIPFEGNEHLLGTTDMPDEMYINW